VPTVLIPVLSWISCVSSCSVFTVSSSVLDGFMSVFMLWMRIETFTVETFASYSTN
jgi:hypothetical protein